MGLKLGGEGTFREIQIALEFKPSPKGLLAKLLVIPAQVRIFQRTLRDDSRGLDIIDIRTAPGVTTIPPQREDIMIKHLITATIFMLGGAGVGLVGYLATDPLSFTHPVRLGFTQRVRELPPAAADRSPAVIPASVPGSETELNSIWLAEVQITAAPPGPGNRR